MGIKDSAFPSATTPLAGTETLVVLQGGVNKKVAVSDFLEAGQPNGLAQLDGTGHVPSGQLPNTDSISEGTTHLYYTDARAQKAVNGLSTGLISGGVLAINAGNNAHFDIPTLVAYFADYTTPSAPTGTYFNYAGSSNNTVTAIATQLVTYVGIDKTGTIYQQGSPFSATQRRTVVPLGSLIHSNHTNINAINTILETATFIGNQLYDLMDALGPMNISGNVFSANDGNLALNLTSGTLFRYGSNYANDPLNPHTVSLAGGNTITFRYRTQLGVESADTTSIIPTSYDNAGTLTTVPGGSFTIQHISIFQSGLVRIQYGQTLYASLANAQSAIGAETFVVEQNIAQNGVLRCYLIVKGSATALNNTTQALFYEVSKFGAAVGGAGTGLNAALIVSALGYTPASTTKTLNTHNANYSLVATDVDQVLISNDGNSHSYTINSNIFSAGQYVYIGNYGTNPLTIVAGTGITLQLTGTATTGNRTVGAYGFATLKFLSPTVCFVDGPAVT